MTPDKFGLHMRALRRAELEFVVESHPPTSQEAIAARAELARRATWQHLFLRTALTALAVSILVVMEKAYRMFL